MSEGQSIPWRRVFLEGFVIVGSILLAFAIDAAWDARGERLDSLETLQVLEQDLLDSQSEVARVIDREEAHAAAFYFFISSTPAELRDLGPDEAATVYMDIGATPTLGAFDAVIRSGQLANLDDPELLRMVSRWSGVLNDILDLGPGLSRNMDDARLAMDPEAAVSRWGRPEPSVEDAAETLARLRVNDSFLTARAVAQRTKVANLAKARTFQQLTIDLLEMVRSRIGDGPL